MSVHPYQPPRLRDRIKSAWFWVTFVFWGIVAIVKMAMPPHDNNVD